MIACSASVVIRELQSSSQGNATSRLSDWQKRSLAAPSVNKAMENWAPEYTGHGIVGPCGERFGKIQ